MATAQAVENRRRNRAARTENKRKSAEEWDRHDRELGDRMVRRYFSPLTYPDGVPLIFLDYRYWQARRCGWNALDPTISRDPLLRPCEAMRSVTWHWWTHLHYKQRGMLARLSRHQRHLGRA